MVRPYPFVLSLSKDEMARLIVVDRLTTTEVGDPVEWRNHHGSEPEKSSDA